MTTMGIRAEPGSTSDLRVSARPVHYVPAAAVCKPPNSEHLHDTPMRMAKAWSELI